VAALIKGKERQSFRTRCRVEPIVERSERDPLAGLTLQVQAARELHRVA
jgi:hypothetical protein